MDKLKGLLSSNDVGSDMQDAAVIDPEDFQLNTIVNSRGYSRRISMSVDFNNIDFKWVEDLEELPLLFCSLDKVFDKKNNRLNTYGIRMHDIVDDVYPAILVSFVSHTKTSFFHVWAHSEEACVFWLDALSYKYVAEQPIEVFDDNTNTRIVSFWGQGSHGYESVERKIVMLPWDETIDKNYPMKVREELEVLHDLTPPINGGRIILFWGVPGTGKSSLIRTLATHWTKWCHISIVTDPEVMLGASAAMMQVLTFDYSRYIDKAVPEDKAYHMVVIEDAGELLEKNAHGQGFSRLLNMADGMLGQSTNLIICITTNKDIQEIHEAISRPGRCVANIHFDEFTRSEALEWLQDFDATRMEEFTAELSKITHQVGHTSKTFTLAELYHVVSQRKQIVREKVSAGHGTYL